MIKFDNKGNLTIFENGKMPLETTYLFRKLSNYTKFPADSTQFILSWKDSNTFFRICSDSLYLPRGSITEAANEVWGKY